MKYRKDGKLLKDINAFNYILYELQKRRTDTEVYGNYKIDVTNVVKYLEKENKKNDVHLTYFHIFALAIGKTVYNRPYLNRFVVNGRFYQRNEVSIGYVAKTSFTDEADELFSTLVIKEDDNIKTISEKLTKAKEKTRANDAGDTEKLVGFVAKLPKSIRSFIVYIFKKLDKHGLMPNEIMNSVPYYNSVLLSNIGSIGCKHAIYHHLSDFGTNEIMITMGKIFKEEVLNEDGKKEIRDFCEFGVTLNEKIADGFYIIKSMQLLEHILDNPKLLENPAGEKIEISK